jgi:ribosomal protein S18 acetylase RimI-like enzyme
MPGVAFRSRVVTRVARPDDLPAVLALVRQHRAESRARGVLTGQTPGTADAAGFRRLLEDPRHRVVLAVLPAAADVPERPVGLLVLGSDPLSAVLGVPQVTVDNLVVDPLHRRRGAGAMLLAAAAAYAEEAGAAHVVATVGGSEAERQRFLSRMGFAPLATRRIVPRETLVRSLAAWQRSWALPAPRRGTLRRRPVARISAPLDTVPIIDTVPSAESFVQHRDVQA